MVIAGDRVRYCWPDGQIDDAFAHLVRNLADSPIPAAADQPVSAAAVREVRSGELQPTPWELIINHIQDILAQAPWPVKANKAKQRRYAKYCFKPD